jgi:transposase-like protein/IS1 family transposase
MIAIACTHEKLTKHGKDRKGNQRWKCCKCGHTVTRELNRPLGDMRIQMSDAVRVLSMLLEGMSIRACERITGMKRDTICDLVLLVGGNCDRFLEKTVRNVPSKFIELDEIWDFVFCKAKTAEKKGYGSNVGDSWTWLAIDGQSKLILSHTVGKRDSETCRTFLTRLNNATTGRCQVTSDGFNAYTYSVPMLLGSRVDFAQLVKTYAANQGETRYSPAVIIAAEKTPRFGQPDAAHISTSYSERFNLSVRMHVRRFTRLTNAHSKTLDHHTAMTSLFVAWYNFCRKHETLKKQTPAMVANLAATPWTIEKLLQETAA